MQLKNGVLSFGDGNGDDYNQSVTISGVTVNEAHLQGSDQSSIWQIAGM